MTAALVLDAKAKLGEGAIWNAIDKKLYWVDIEGKLFHTYDPSTKSDTTFSTFKMAGTVVPAGHNQVLLALEDGIALMTLPDGKIEYKLKTDIHQDNKRFNDGKCDAHGRFWVGSLTLESASNDNKLYCMTPDFNLIEKADGLTISNGIAWNADGTKMYHIDTPTSEITSHDFDKLTGNISNRQVAVKVPTEMGYPDGMTIDSEGMLWVALWDGFCVARYNPNNGDLLEKIDVPAPKVTSCAFGGDDLKELYITTASCEMTDNDLQKYPLSGGLFVVHLDTKGTTAFHFS